MIIYIESILGQCTIMWLGKYTAVIIKYVFSNVTVFCNTAMLCFKMVAILALAEFEYFYTSLTRLH